jgi:ribosome-associated protein
VTEAYFSTTNRKKAANRRRLHFNNWSFSSNKMPYTLAMIEISPYVTLDENELKFEYVRATGPGGQNVNKVATSAQLRFDVAHSPSLPEAVRERLTRLGGSRMTGDGILIIEARRYRTQEQNRTDAIQRLIVLIHKAQETPVTRRKTRPTLSSKKKRLEEKKQRGEIKRGRSGKSDGWD